MTPVAQSLDSDQACGVSTKPINTSTVFFSRLSDVLEAAVHPEAQHVASENHPSFLFQSCQVETQSLREAEQHE